MREIENKEIKVRLHEVFSAYVADNIHSLSGAGVIATIAALFLTLDPTIFTDGLKDVQLVLLLILLLSLLAITVNTFLWMIKKTEVLFGGVIIATQILLLSKVANFISANFSQEFKSYLAYISLSVVISIGLALSHVYKKYESYIEKQTSGYQPLLYAILIFGFFYFLKAGANIYLDFAKDLTINLSTVLNPFTDPMVWAFPLYIGVAHYAINNVNIRGYRKTWLSILALPLLGFSLHLGIYLWEIFN